MNTLLRYFWESEGAKYHGVAIGYAAFGYMVGIAGVFNDAWFVNLLATVLLAHSMIVAAYLIHECGHNTVFRDNVHNARLGKFMSWLCGAAYGTYEDMRFKHFRHHVDNADVAWFDHATWFRRHPLMLRVCQFLEWCYIPAHELLMHAVMMFTSFVIPERRGQRLRNVLVILVRVGVFVAVLVVFPKVAFLYALAYMLMLVVLRHMDAVQHDYGGSFTLFSDEPAPRKGDLEWEQMHTFSNPISLQYEKLNWLVLNFGFHNAHHARPTLPWYRLPALHGQLMGDDPGSVIPLGAQLRIYNNGRVNRVCKGKDMESGGAGPEGAGYLHAAQRAEITGGNAASFLTSF